MKVNEMLEQARDNTNSQDRDATAHITPQSVALYQQAIEQTANSSDATERVTPQTAALYQQTMEQLANANDATERVTPQSAALYQQAMEQLANSSDATERLTPQAAALYQKVMEQTANANDATKRVPIRHSTRLYQKAMEQTITQAVSPADSTQAKTQSVATVPPLTTRKRSRRKFLHIFHLLADILLIVLLLGFAGLEIAEHQTQAQQMQKAAQIRQQSLQYAAQLSLLMAREQKAQLDATAHTLVAQFNQEVESWGKAHLYHDSFDGKSYMLDSGYTQAGIGSFINGDLTSAQTINDFQALISETQNALFNLHMLEADYNDHTSYTQTHVSDLSLLNYYQLSHKTVLLVSSVEQVMRVYQQGKLVRSFYITAGRAERPSLPGDWPVVDRRSPVIFESGDPPGSPYWFPNTLINYAILYHFGGFFVHDAPWRGSFGPGTQFPHQDASGNTPYNFDGSHGCINLSEADAAWVYQHTDWNTVIVIY